MKCASVTSALAIIGLCAIPAFAVEPPASVPSAGAGTFSAEEKTAPPESTHPALTASAWCALRDRDEPAAELEPGCDAGLAAAFYRHGRLALVGAIGTETVGLGAAWVVWSGDGPTVAVAGGVIAPYDGEGVYPREWAPALGVTMSWGRPR